MKSKSIIAVDQGQSPWWNPKAVLGIVVVGVVLTWFAAKILESPKPAPIPSATRTEVIATPHPVSTVPSARVKRERTAFATQTVPPVRQRELATSAEPEAAAGSTTYAQQLVAGLTQFSSGGLSTQKAEELKRSFKELAEQGSAAVPAIREYLDRFQDLDFDPAGAGKLVGYSSLRMGLLDVLGQIGGPEAAELSLQTLQRTGDTQEIAFLAKGLEKQLPPDQVRPIALAAASEVLAQALNGKWEGRSITPVFEVLQKYGDESVVGLLEQSVGKWNYYATLALAGLPDGAGVPALVRLAQDPAVKASGNGDFALRPLAQAAMQYPEARAALVDQARLNQIPDRAWPTVASSLSGSYVQYGNQIFGSTAPAVAWTEEQISSRLSLIDQMLAATSNASGKQALLDARAVVLSRTPK